jgi:hypothetical protein
MTEMVRESNKPERKEDVMFETILEILPLMAGLALAVALSRARPFRKEEPEGTAPSISKDREDEGLEGR